MLWTPIFISATVFALCLGIFVVVKRRAARRPETIQASAANDDIKRLYSKRRVADLKQIDGIVVGSGTGALTTAVALARRGYKLLVLEQHDVAGGCTHVYEENGFEFDTGLHYIGGAVHKPNSQTRRVFDLLTNNQLQWAQMDDAFDTAVLGSERTFDMASSSRATRQNLYDTFPEEHAAIDEYFRLLRATKQCGARLVVQRLCPHWLYQFLAKHVFAAGAALQRRTVSDVLEGLTDNVQLRSVLTYLCGDYGLAPSEASFAIHGMVVGHYANGAAYPVGGSSEIARLAVQQLRALGSEVLVRCAVESLLVEGGRCVGVQTRSGDQIFAPLVISGAGYANTMGKLLPKDLRPTIAPEFGQVLSQIGSATGHISLFVGLEGVDGASLPRRNYWVFGTEDVDGGYKQYLSDDEWHDDMKLMGAFVSFPGAKDPEWGQRYGNDRSTCLVVTEGKYGWFGDWKQDRVKRRGAEYQRRKQVIADKLFAILYKQFPYLEGKVAHFNIGTPLSNDYYLGSWQGSSYGLAHTPTRFSELGGTALSPRTRLPGLWLTGQDVLTCGVSGAAIAGMVTAIAIDKRVIWDNLSILTA